MRCRILAGVSILSVLVTIGCATMTSEERTYLERVMATPLTVTIPSTDADEAWERAKSWIKRFSSMEPQTVSEGVIKTLDPASGLPLFGYYVTKERAGDHVEIAVKCNCGNASDSIQADKNGRILAYFIKTGELHPRFIMK
jgi:hypothetical protein